MHVSDLPEMYPMNLEEDRLVCGRRFPLQLGVVLVCFFSFSVYVRQKHPSENSLNRSLENNEGNITSKLPDGNVNIVQCC